MNSEQRAEAAEMERAKKEALSRVEPGQGGQDSESRHYTTSLVGANQEHRSQPASVQRARLLGMLRRGPVSTLEARAVAIMSPATRVFELKRQGHEIITTRLPNRVGVYHLVREAQP
jgi:hypothetical protein